MSTTTSRYALHKPSGSDSPTIPADIGTALDQIDGLLVGGDQGLASSRPSTRPNGFLYYATDTGVVSMCEDGSWVTISQPASQRAFVQWPPATPGGIFTTTTATALPLGTAATEQSISGAYTKSGNAIVVPSAGLYRVSTTVLVDSQTAGAAVSVQVDIGTLSWQIQNNPPSGDLVTVSPTTLVRKAASGTIDVKVHQLTGNVASALLTHLLIERVGA